MNNDTAQILCKINNDFYRRNHESFSSTRSAPWNGWKTCAEILDEAWNGVFDQVSVLDLACGNLRFESFLQTSLPDRALIFYAVDDCDELVEDIDGVQYQSLDIVNGLLQGDILHELIEAPLCDVSVSFGFMHHIPGQDLRAQALRSLVNMTKPGGFVIVSFWRFLTNEVLARKAEATHKLALDELDLPPLDRNDYLLGWKSIPGEYRYCHSFSDEEIDELVAACSANTEVVSRFTADGRSDDLNEYVILRTLR